MIGKNLKQYRESLGLSPRQLAKKCNVSAEWIYQVEQGTVTNVGLEKIAEVARGLGVSPNKLLPKEFTDVEINQTDLPIINHEEQILVELWRTLSPEQKRIAKGMMNQFAPHHGAKQKKIG